MVRHHHFSFNWLMQLNLGVVYAHKYHHFERDAYVIVSETWIRLFGIHYVDILELPSLLGILRAALSSWQPVASGTFLSHCHMAVKSLGVHVLPAA